MVIANAQLDLAEDQRDALRRSFRSFFEMSRPKILRTFIEFAEQEIVIVEGRLEGSKFRTETQPFSRLVLESFDDKRWSRYICYGCVQSGKTLLSVIIPAAKTLFDNNENFGAGVPTMDIAADKWRDEYHPTFKRSFDRYLPRKAGAGSRGGRKFEAITFTNGRTLKFLSGSGGSEKRSGITLRNIGITEADKVDVPPIKSTDPNPIGEIEGRLASHGDDSKFWAECTVTTKQGYVYREWLAGSQGQIMKPCPHCKVFVCPGREHFVGWEDATDEATAREHGTFICPECAVIITPEERRAMCLQSALVHRGQRATIGTDGCALIEGDLPGTRTCGIRWSAFDNQFWSYEFIAAKMWRAANPTDEADEESTEKWVTQYMFAEPWEPDEIDLTPLTLQEMRARSVAGAPRGQVTEGASWLSAGVDCSKRRLHFGVRDWVLGDSVRGHALDIDEWPVPSDKMGTREALFTALCELRDKRIGPGYRDTKGQVHPVAWTLVDCGWQKEVVMSFMLDCKTKGIKGWMAVLGRGQSEPPGGGTYNHPKAVDGVKILWRGEQCHIRMDDEFGLPVMFVNTDHWKTFIRDGYTTPSVLDNGALTHHEAETRSDKEIIDEWNKHHRAENRFRKVVPGRGPVDVWRNDSNRPNHHLDDDVYACAAGNLAGVRVVTKTKPRLIIPTTAAPSPETHDDRPYLANNRED